MSIPLWIYTEILDEWLDKTAWNKSYWGDVAIRSAFLRSDGCSGVPDFYRWSCMEHDIHYRTHKMLDGVELTKEIADYIFRRRIQQKSWFCKLSPMSWWRWLAVKHFGQKAWDHAAI